LGVQDRTLFRTAERYTTVPAAYQQRQFVR
jgi:hypothetical protein